MKIQAYQCTSCGDTVYSRCANDVTQCSCGITEIAKGFENPSVRRDGTLMVKPKLIELEINADPDILYWDWDLFENKFGLISEFTNEPVIVLHEFKFRRHSVLAGYSV